jgi:hypothetical protein
MFLVAQSEDKGASGSLLLTHGTSAWGPFGFSKQFQKRCSRKLDVSLLDIGCLRWMDIDEQRGEIIGPGEHGPVTRGQFH